MLTAVGKITGFGFSFGRLFLFLGKKKEIKKWGKGQL